MKDESYGNPVVVSVGVLKQKLVLRKTKDNKISRNYATLLIDNHVVGEKIGVLWDIYK